MQKGHLAVGTGGKPIDLKKFTLLLLMAVMAYTNAAMAQVSAMSEKNTKDVIEVTICGSQGEPYDDLNWHPDYPYFCDSELELTAYPNDDWENWTYIWEGSVTIHEEWPNVCYLRYDPENEFQTVTVTVIDDQGNTGSATLTFHLDSGELAPSIWSGIKDGNEIRLYCDNPDQNDYIEFAYGEHDIPGDTLGDFINNGMIPFDQLAFPFVWAVTEDNVNEIYLYCIHIRNTCYHDRELNGINAYITEENGAVVIHSLFTDASSYKFEWIGYDTQDDESILNAEVIEEFETNISSFVPQNINDFNYYRLRVSPKNGNIKFCMYSNVLTAQTLSVSDNYSPDNITIYPNPAHDRFTVKGEGTLVIFNSIGQKVRELEIDNEATIDGLPAGMYFVQVGGMPQKVVVE